jgi:hypothetical protein
VRLGDLIIPVKRLMPSLGLLIGNLMSFFFACSIQKRLFDRYFPDTLALEGQGHQVHITMVKSESVDYLALHPENLQS